MSSSQIHDMFFELAIQKQNAMKYAFHEHRWFDVVNRLNLPKDYSDLYGVFDGFYISSNSPNNINEIFLVGNFGKTINELGAIFDNSTVLMYIEIKTNWRDFGEYLFAWDEI